MGEPLDLTAPLVADLLARCSFPPAGAVATCAVSGGADSLSLLVLAVAAGCEVTAVHVDHGLRDGSAAEAGVVADLAARVGAGFRSERVSVAPGPNLEARARAARYGVLPDQASIDQQIEFAMTDPYEKQLMAKAFSVGGTAEQLGVAYSRHYEAHGNAVEDAKRGRAASALAGQYPAGGSPGTTVNITNMQVNTPNAQAFVGGIERLSDSQNYNSVMR